MPSPPLPSRIEIKGDLSSPRKTASRGQDTVANRTKGQNFALYSNVLTVFCTVLMVALFAIWSKWQTAEDRARIAERRAAISANFGDGILQELALAREQSAKLDRERGNVVRMLGEAERLHASLRGELGQWQRKQEETVAASQAALAEVAQEKQAQASELGKTQAELNQSTQKLDQERMATQQELDRADAELQKAAYEAQVLAQQRNAAEAQKSKAERAQQELDKKAQVLNEENNRMDGDISRLKGVINNEEILRNELNLRNVALAAEANQLRAAVGRLETKLRELEQERDKDRDRENRQQKRSN